MWVVDDPLLDPWHYELLSMGFSWRYGFPNEYYAGRRVARFYWKDPSTSMEKILSRIAIEGVVER